MIKKSITWEDLDGNVRTEDFYFNFTKAEVIELQVSRKGGFAESLEYLAKGDDKKEELAVIKEIILKAYGRRGADPREFIKVPEHAQAFSHTEAYSNLFVELFTNPDEANRFFRSLLPADMQEAAAAEAAKRAGTWRPPTQDYQKKQPETVPAVGHTEQVKESPEQPHDGGVEIIPSTPEHRAKISLASFQAFSQEDAQRFLAEGGVIDPEL